MTRRRRRVRVLAVLVAGAATVSGFGCAADNTWALRHLDAEGECIVVFGDSLTAGLRVDPAEAFPALLATDLGVPIVAEGVSGETTAQGLERFDSVVPRHRPFLVVIEFGYNDFTSLMPQDETLRNIEQLVRRVHALPAAAVVISVDVDRIAMPPGETGVGTLLQRIGDRYGRGYRAIARRRGTGLVTGLLNDVVDHPQYMVDPIHPNPAGHALLAARVRRVLRPMLDRMPAAERLRGHAP